MLKVAILGLKGDFNKAKGMGIQRYMYELYNRTKSNKSIKVTKVESAFFGIKNGLSFVIGSMFKDYSGYDILHNLDLKPFFPLKKTNAITLATAHDFYNVLRPELNKHLLMSLKGRLNLSLIVKYGIKSTLNADYIIAVSSLVKNDAVSLGYDANKISIVNLGLDERFIARKKPVTKEHIFNVGYIGSFATNKNVSFAIEAFKKTDNLKTIFTLWGKKTFEYNELFALAGGKKQIKFMGFVQEDRIVQAYDDLDIFLYPSLYDGFGLPILEAQSRGLPVVIYKNGKLAKEVRKYCFEAESPEHMAQIIEHIKKNGYNEKLKKKATEYARSFTWDKCAKETLEVYKRLYKDV